MGRFVGFVMVFSGSMRPKTKKMMESIDGKTKFTAGHHLPRMVDVDN